MFDLIFSAFQAYTQVGMFVAAVICLGIGGLLLGNALYWRVHAVRATGTIIGVIPQNGMYTAVYRYVLPDGTSHEAKSDMSTGWLRGYQTGRKVPLLISWSNPAEARNANNFLLDIFGIVLILPGLLFGHIALTAYPFTPMTWIVAALMLLYLVERAFKVLIPKGERLSIAEWKKRHNIGRAGSIDPTGIMPAEAILASPEMQQRSQAELQKNKWVMPILALFGIGLIAGGAYEGFRTVQFLTAGLRAQGEVVRLQEEGSGNDYSYHPVVRFRTDQNATVEFKDSAGSNPPLYRPGDPVTVLFLAIDPERNAMIDHGVWNWAIPAILLLFGAFLAWISVVTWRSGSNAAQIFRPRPEGG